MPEGIIRTKIKYTVVVGILLCFSFQALAQNFSEQKITTTIRVWGLLKYYSPFVYKSRVNWDDVLTTNYRSITEAGDADEFNHVIAGMIDTVYNKTKITAHYSQSIENTLRENRMARISNFSLLSDTLRYIVRIDFSWLVSNVLLSEVNRKKLIEILINYQPREGSKYLRKNKDNIVSPVEEPFQAVTIWEGKVLTVPEEYRFLAFARFWNIINYLYPYKQILDVNWDYFLDAEGCNFIKNKYYYGAVQTMISRLCDGHVSINFDQLKVPDNGSSSLMIKNKYFMPFGIKYIADQAYISVFADSLKCVNAGIQKGDRLVELAGQDVDSSIAINRSYYSTANASALKSKIEQQFAFRQFRDSIINIKIQRGGNLIALDVRGMKDVQFRGSLPKTPDFMNINDSTVYINIGAPSDVFYKWLDSSVDKNIILDMRSYPEGLNAFYVNAFINCGQASVSNYYYPDCKYPGVFIKNSFAINYDINFKKIANVYKHGLRFYDNNGIYKSTFKNRLIVLIDGNTISQSETVCMMIKTCYPEAVFIGRQTAGSNGDVVDKIFLPGGVSFSYTSIDFHFADGRPVQRVGILPDRVINDSIDFLDQCNDLILEKAIGVMNSK